MNNYDNTVNNIYYLIVIIIMDKYVTCTFYTEVCLVFLSKFEEINQMRQTEDYSTVKNKEWWMIYLGVYHSAY